MTYFLKIFGCQMNYSDAERIETILEKYKLKKSASIEEADFVIFVTCGVRQSAEDRVYGQINNIQKKYPQKKIVLTGCLAHRKDVQRRLKNKVDLYIPIKEISNPKKWKNIISQNIEYSCYSKNIQCSSKKIQNTRYKIPDTENWPSTDYLKATPRYTSSCTAYIPIMTGCNNFCAYCVVPYARGREYSRSAEDILKEVKFLVKKGYKEIILLGQNVNSYQAEFITKPKILNTKYQIPNIKIGFADLLKLIDSIPGNFWLTFLTSHPKDMSDELIDTIAKGKKICEYISLPAQSGDNEILKKMNRHYTVAHYKNLIHKIRKAYKGSTLGNSDVTSEGKRLNLGSKLPPAISTDIIVGFPGEIKKQFENTAKLFREMKFDMAYISQYSPRPETAAWRLKDNVGKYEKVRREKILTEILAKTALKNNKEYVGKIVEVLVDKELSESLALRNSKSLALGREKPSFELKSLALRKYKYLAHTRTQKKAIFRSNKKIPVGSFQKVKITKAKAFGLEGKIV